MERRYFRIGDVFPHDHPVSQFLTGLCMAVNDMTLTLRHMEAHMAQSGEPPDDQPGVNLSYLYRLCVIYREAAGLLWQSLDDPQVASFLNELSPAGHRHLAAAKESFSSWNDSFVKDKVKPIRDATSHYKHMALDDMGPRLEIVSDERSWIEFGRGTDTWYEFAEAVFKTHLLEAAGHSARELEDFMRQVVKLVLAFISFANEAVTIWLRRVDQDVFAVTE